jgi:capsular polysaccharide biosynthesis protein
VFISTPSTGVADTYSATLTAGQRAESYADLARGSEVLDRVANRLDADLSRSQLADQITTTVVEST